MISYIIPHKNRRGLLDTHLKMLNNSVFNDYEVIVVNDGSDYTIEDIPGVTVVNLSESHGAAYARNTGAKIAKGDIFLFVGDDCIPTEDLLLHHWSAHQGGDVDIVQGYTGFHPNQLGTHFMTFLDKSGMQANWGGLRKDGGGWKKEINGFFLTTNVSIKADNFFELGGFSTNFKKAAWEDVEFGTRAGRNGLRTIFEPSAVNFHQHGYTYWEFCKRQFMEGTQRLTLILEHPEMSPSLVNPNQIREVKKYAHELEAMNNGLFMGNMNIQKIVDLQYQVWGEGLQVMSILGIISQLEKNGGLWNVFFHIHEQQQVSTATYAIRALSKNDYGYAQHCKHWLLDNHSDNWGLLMFAAEIDRACNDKEMSQYYHNKAKAIAYNEKWVQEFAD